MKKTYIKPKIQTYHIENMIILATSHENGWGKDGQETIPIYEDDDDDDEFKDLF
jgi:hypothetical protein